MSLLTKLTSEVSELKKSEKESKPEEKLSFEVDSSTRTSSKNSQSLEDFFKQKLAVKMKKPEDRKNQETHIDDVEERPREKLWKRYGDYRGISFELRTSSLSRMIFYFELIYNSI